MDNYLQGFRHVEELKNLSFKSWNIITLKKVDNISHNLVQMIDPNITNDIKIFNLVKITSYEDEEGEHEVNILVYDIEYLVKETNTQKYSYISVEKLNNIIRMKKLESILQ